MSSCEMPARTSVGVCPNLEEAVADAVVALRAAGVDEPRAMDIRDTVQLARGLLRDWPAAVRDAADIIARRTVPPLPSPYGRAP